MRATQPPVPSGTLSERLGAAAFEARRALEIDRAQGYGGGCINRFAAALSRFSGVLALVFRLVGLHRHAYRQYHGVALRHHPVRIDRLPPALSGFRILQLSDLHIDLDMTLIDTLERLLRDVTCDLCVITGDFRNQILGSNDAMLAAVGRLQASLPAPTYAILGNHDALEIIEPLETMGIRFLLNEQVRIGQADAGFHLIGIDDPNIYRTHDLARATRGIPEGAVRILLSHSPAIYTELGAHDIDLVLAGHTHGGQICLPGGHILLRNDPSPRRLLRGPWRVGRTQGYTSAGTGACGVPLRLFCLPEITLHTLVV